jgi:glycosidase
MMNLLDSHDTFRYLEIAQGDIGKLKLALIFQMTYVGTPHIWYGDEIAMRGAHDPDCRRPFNWLYTNDPEKVALREFYQKLIRLRRNNPVLIYGDFKTIWVEGLVYAYSRIDLEQEILVALNNSDRSNVLTLNTAFESKYTDQISGREYFTAKNKLRIKLEKYSGAILIKENN